MSRRDIMAVMVSMIVLGTAAWILFAMDDDGVPKHQWCFDRTTGRLFVADIAAVPPMPAPSGLFHGEPAGVQAVVLRRGDGTRDIAYLRTFTPELSTLIRAARAGHAELPRDEAKLRAGVLVAAVPVEPGTPPQWYAAESAMGHTITAFPTEESSSWVVDLP